MDLANVLREERKSAELQPLDEDFYQQVGIYLTGMGQELSRVEDPFSVEAQILQDTLKSERGSLNKLIDQRIKKIVRRALEEPSRQIAINAGEEGSIVVREILAKKGNVGYNAATGEFEDLVKAGVIDPAKVAKTALLNAASIAGLMLTTEAMVSEIKEKEPKAPAMPGGGMGGMY